MTADEVHEIESHFSAEVRSNADLQTLLSRRGSTSVTVKVDGRKLVGFSCLLTWNGKWGLIPYKGLVQVPPSEHDYDQELEEVVSWLREAPAFASLWEAFEERMRAIHSDIHAKDMAWALEVCTHTLRNDRTVRVHGHAFVAWHLVQSLKENDFCKMDFNGSKCFVASSFGGSHPRQRLLAVHNGFFYLLCGKDGSLRANGTKQLWTDITVRPPMILQLFVQAKLSFATARELFLRAGFSAEQNVKNLEYIALERRKKDLVKLVLEVELQLRSKMLPPLTIEIVQREWEPQYDEIKDRYKFLVLEGDSCKGKTRWARLRGEPHEIFEVDCAGKSFMDLRGLIRPQHKYCLCDEAGPNLILQNRKLFQAGASMCNLGESATGMYSYKVWPFRLRFIIMSNNWTEQIKKLEGDADRDWIRMNSVYHYCDKPLYVRPAGEK